MSNSVIDRKKLERTQSFNGFGMSPKNASPRLSSKEAPAYTDRAFQSVGAKQFEDSRDLTRTQNSIMDDAVSTRDDLSSLDSDPIFQRLCGKEMHKNDPQCKICSKQFNALKLITKKICHFCGECVCEEHGRKKRANPQNPSEFVRICDICEEKHIKRIILQEFDRRMKKKERDVQEWENKIKDQQLKINDAQGEYDHLMIEKNRNDKNHAEQVTFLTNEISRMKEEIKKCEKDNTWLTKDFNDTQKKVEELDGKIHESQEEYERLLVEASTLNKQIEATTLDIEQIGKRIRAAEDMINQKKVGKGVYGGGRLPDGFGGGSVQDTGRLGSFESSILSDNTVRVRSHYQTSSLNPHQKRKSRLKEEPGMSGQCSKCNIF